jgi:hypothetical protein
MLTTLRGCYVHSRQDDGIVLEVHMTIPLPFSQSNLSLNFLACRRNPRMPVVLHGQTSPLESDFHTSSIAQTSSP